MSDTDELPEATWNAEIEPKKVRVEGGKEILVEPARVHLYVGQFGSFDEAKKRSCRLDANGVGCLIQDLQRLERDMIEGDYGCWPVYEE